MADFYVDLFGDRKVYTKDGKEVTQDTKIKRKTGFFQTPALFKDGYQFGDITGTILGTAVDTASTVVKGAGKFVEGMGDSVLYGASEVADFFGADGADRWLKNAAKTNLVENAFAPIDNTIGEYSVWGDTSSAILEGVGQVGAMITIGKLGKVAGLGGIGTTALTTGATFASSLGSGIGEAYQAGATDGQAWAYGAMKGGIDAASEMIFGGLGKTVKALGFSRGISSLDDIFARKASSKISNYVLKNAVQFGIKASGEGLEEVIAGYGSAVAKKLTYASDEELRQLVKDENLLEQFIVGAISSGIVQSPGAYSSIKNRTDFITGYTANEEAVVEAEANKRIKAKEAEGAKVTAKEKNKIYEDVKKDLERGYIDVDTIESTLKSEEYNSYKSMSEQKEAMQKEYDELYHRKDRDKSDADRDRQKELKAQLEELTASSAKAREQLDTDMNGIIQNSRLAESYNERTRRSQVFKTDPTKYNEKERAVVQKAMESGILNNTNRTHDFVDMLAKISAEKGVSFDFINNQRLKESGFALEGKTVNGFIKDGNVSLNIDSAKAMNAVVGHEITHVLEGTELYGELQQAVKAFAESKGEYGKRLEALQKLYAGVEGANIENELTADLIGDYLFTDSDFVNRLSTEKPGLFKRIFEEIKYLVKTATAGSKQARELEKVKRAFEKAYKENGDVKADVRLRYGIDSNRMDNFLEQVKNQKGQTDYKYNQWQFAKVPDDVADGIYKATDGRVNAENKNFAFEGSKLSHEFISHGDENAEKSIGQKSYSEGDINKIIETLMEPDIIEDISSGDKLDQRNAVAFAKEVDGEMIVVAAIGGKRNPNIVPEQILWFTKEKWDAVSESGATLREVIYENSPKRGKISQEEKEKIKKNRVTVVHGESDDSSARYVQDVPRSPLKDSIPQNEENATTSSEINVLTDKGLTMTYVRVPNQNTQNHGGTYGQNIEPAGEYMSMDTMQGQHKIEGYEYGTIQFKNPLVLEHISTSDTGWKKTVSDMYKGLTGKKLTQALIKDGYDAIVTYDEYGYSEIVNLNGTKLNDSLDLYSVSDSSGRQLSEGQREYFKDSKVRDENGALKPVYHGTNKEFSRFESVDGTYWFSEDVDYAEAMAEERSGSRIIEVYLDIKNPYMTKLPPNQFSDPNSEKSIIRYAKANGYDGVIIENDTDVELEKETFYVAFDQAQIKSVDNQNPTENQDINLSLSETSFDIAPSIGNNVYGKDIALDLPIREDLRQTEEIAPVQQSQTQKELGPERADIVQKDDPNPEGNAPAEQTYSPDELPTWENVKKADTYTPEPESYPQKKVTTVKERNAAKLQSLKVQMKNEQDLMKKSHDSYNAEIRDLQSEYARKKNKNTKAAQELLDKIERRKNNRDNTDAYYEKRISDIKKKIDKMNTKEFKIVEQRQSKQEEYQTTLGELMGDTSTWVDKKMGIYYKVNTLRRNLRDIVRDEKGNRDIAKADAIYDELQGKYNHNEAKLNREANEIKAKYAGLKITAEEDAYIQMLGEYRHNPDTTLTADAMTEFYEKHKKKIDTKKVDEIISSARQLYDELFHRVNATLVEQGMRPIEYREGYFPHFTDDKQGWLAKLLNWKTKKDNIPTDIAGLTEQFKPVRSWQSFDKHRTGDSTDYSFKKGLDMYVQGALDWIYHIGDIQKRRAFENEIRYRHSDQGIKDKVEAIRNNPEYDASEVQDQIDLVYKEARNPLNNFVTDFRTQTNTLAGKKSSMDRGTEEWSNRAFYSTMTNITNRVTANMVGGSISSALTNFIPITQSWAQVSPLSSLKAMGNTIRSYYRNDGTIEKSDFLTNRLEKSKKLYQTGWDKFGDKVGWLMETVDNFTAQTVWRSKYLENMNAGMSESEAIKNADQFAENVMAGRSRGNNPTIFDAKNPIMKMVTAFQLEVNNQYGYLFKDVPQDMKNEAKGRLLKGYAGVFVGAWVYNMLYSAMTGRDAAFDPIGMVLDVLKDLGLGDDEEPEDIGEVIGNLTDSVLEEVPFVGGLLGGGRIPISSALPYDNLKEAITGTIQDVSEGDWKNLTNEWLNPVFYLLPPVGGGQARKTIQGLDMFSDKHPIAGSYTTGGDLRFAVEDTPMNRIQAALFGQWSSQNAREYIEEGRSPLSEKQTQELIDTDLPMADYWKYRDGLKGKSSTQEKIEYIADLNLPIDTKNILANNVVQRETPVDLTDYDKFAEYEEFDFFCKNKEMYNFLKENEISYAEYKGYDDKAKNACRSLLKTPEKRAFMAENGVSVADYCTFDAETKEAYDWAYKYPEKYKLSQYVTEDVAAYRKMVEEIGEITADKGRGGATIPYSKNKKIIAYINNLDIDYGQRMILYRMVCGSDDTYNYRIVEYLNDREDISRSEMEFILQGLGMTVTKDGKVRW